MLIISLKMTAKNRQPPLLTSLLLLSHLLHHASVYLNRVHFLTPCTLAPRNAPPYRKICFIISCIASHDAFQDRAVITFDR